MTSVLEPENRRASLAEKTVSVKNGLSTVRQKTFHTVICIGGQVNAKR